MNLARFYLDQVVSQREWSWSVIGICYLLLSLSIRQLLLRKVVKATKDLGNDIFIGIRNAYLRESWGGWSIYLMSFLTVTTIWVGWKALAGERYILVLLSVAVTGLFFLSVILHLSALSQATLLIFRRRIGVEKEF